MAAPGSGYPIKQLVSLFRGPFGKYPMDPLFTGRLRRLTAAIAWKAGGAPLPQPQPPPTSISVFDPQSAALYLLTCPFYGLLVADEGRLLPLVTDIAMEVGGAEVAPLFGNKDFARAVDAGLVDDVRALAGYMSKGTNGRSPAPVCLVLFTRGDRWIKGFHTGQGVGQRLIAALDNVRVDAQFLCSTLGGRTTPMSAGLLDFMAKGRGSQFKGHTCVEAWDAVEAAAVGLRGGGGSKKSGGGELIAALRRKGLED
jgi:hypothetical protein